MHLSSCRALKEEMVSIVRRQLTESVVLTARSLRGRNAPRLRRTRPVAAFGLAPVEGKKQDFKLAVRVFRGQDRQAAPLLKRMERYRDELDLVRGVRYLPRVDLRAGGSCGHYNLGGSGTLGGFVEDDDRYYILSNNHVLANSDDAYVGDPILQPGPGDIRNRYSVVGELHRWVPLRTRRTDGVDAAIASFSDRVRYFYPWHYIGIGETVPKLITDRLAVINVIKRGRTTRVRRGVVSAYELDGVAIDYGTPSKPKVVTYDDQIEFVGSPASRAFSQPGDSGSFIFDADTLRPYALLYAGGSDAAGIDRTIGQFMPDVLNLLGVRLVQ